MAKDTKNKKKERRVNPLKKAKKDEKKKAANDGRVKARESLRERRDKIAQNKAKKEKLEKELENAEEEEKKRMKAEIDTIMSELQDDEKAVQDATAEEAKFKQDEEDADNEDEYSDMDVDDDDDPNKPKDSIETETETEQGIDPVDIVEKLMQGVRLSDPAEVTDITRDALLRPKQKVTCYKDGFGKPAIVVDCEIPKWIIYRIRKDVLIPENCPNLMTWRRAGVVKDRTTKKKWSVDDISKVQGIAIEVPEGYDKEPEELVKLIPKLSGTEKDKLKEKGKPIPKQPDVQLLIEWKDGMMVPVETGETDENGKPKLKERFTSWESRSGCRTLWKKHRIADAFLLEVAMKREGGYRNAGGRHSSEIRSMSPFDIPSPGSTPGPDEEEEATENELTENEETSDEKEKERKKKKKKADERKQEREEKEKKEKEEKEKEEKEREEKEKKDRSGGNALAYKTNLKAFEPKFRMLEDIEADAKLTATQKGEMIEAFDAYWEKKQAK